MTSPKLIIFDLDGTLHRGPEPLDGAIECLKALRHLGCSIRFLTNNASKHRSELARSLQAMGFDVEEREFYSSAMGAALAMQNEGLSHAFSVGEPGMLRTLEDYGIDPNSATPEVVIAGICRSISYDWISEAMHHVRTGAQFWATNRDATYPAEAGQVFPGAGAIVGALIGCLEIEPRVLGKPEPFLVHEILRETGYGPEDALVVGDRLDTDIEAGKRAGCRTHLVLSGVTTSSSAEVASSPHLAGLSHYWGLNSFGQV